MQRAAECRPPQMKPFRNKSIARPLASKMPLQRKHPYMKPIQKSGEDYLEAVYNLSQKEPKVRSIDVAKTLGVSKPSTFKALQNLAAQGYIEKENYGSPRLTPKGTEYAQTILKKHKAIRMLLIDVLKVSPAAAEADACKIEHVISEETTNRLFEFLKIN